MWKWTVVKEGGNHGKRCDPSERVRKEATDLRSLGHFLRRLGPSFCGMLDGCGDADLQAVKRGWMVHLQGNIPSTQIE